MYVMLQINSKHDNQTSLNKEKRYHCLDNKNSIIMNTFDRNYIVRLYVSVRSIHYVCIIIRINTVDILLVLTAPICKVTLLFVYV